MTPLQYQKQLRLLEARLLLADGFAEQATYTVGYESPTQFSREYAWMFGLPPHRVEFVGGGLARTVASGDGGCAVRAAAGDLTQRHLSSHVAEAGRRAEEEAVVVGEFLRRRRLLVEL